MKINKQELADFYKEIEVKRLDDGIIVVNLWKDKERDCYNAVSLMFAYGKIIYTGDMGYYIFGRDVNNIFNFYKGDEINPEYWSEKGFAFAEKDGKKLWRALDVFTVSEPTKEGVIALGNMLGGVSDEKTEQKGFREFSSHWICQY